MRLYRFFALIGLLFAFLLLCVLVIILKTRPNLDTSLKAPPDIPVVTQMQEVVTAEASSSAVIVSLSTTSPAIFLSSTKALQGEPVLVSISDTDLAEVKGILFEGKNLGVFSFDGRPSALIAIDLNKKIGKYPVVAELSNGEKIEKVLTVTLREKVEAPLGIPESLGGNTKESQDKLVVSLANEAEVIKAVPTSPKKLWKSDFVFPIKDPIITDEYGYSRQTGEYSIPHKGTDFKAKEGTAVFAMNDGLVRIAREFRTYGNMIIVDHGFGLMTLYLHLSKFDVKEGDVVKAGQMIGLSGKTGYAEGPHLHISVRINNISIDPMRFMSLFGKTL